MGTAVLGKSVSVIQDRDKVVLRQLAEKQMHIAGLPIQSQKAAMWCKLNQREFVKPMVWINEICWNEFGLEEQLETVHPFCRAIELELRKNIYQWEHLPADMVVEDRIYCPYVVEDSGFGIDEISQKMRTSQQSVASRHFAPQIREEKDIEKIKNPIVRLDDEATLHNYELMQDIFKNLIPAIKRGACGFWFAPWDRLVTWWGVQEMMIDLIERPDMVKAAMGRLVNAYLYRLDQYERLNLLSLNNSNVRIGSGGLGFTPELPQRDFDGKHVRPKDLWGCAAAQIFSEVSPEMHKEFALDFEMRWLCRFGLNYYGCCEPLHRKIGILKDIPNLCKISISPWANLDEAVTKIGKEYVISYKPNPAILAEETWEPKKARDQLVQALEKMRGCVVEVIMKDISTVRNEPQRLWEWAQIAAEVTDMFA